MKALTVCQPYAELIARGDKPIENRTWPTDYRGPLAIHAGKSRSWLDPGELELYPDMAFGAIVAVAMLADCVPLDALAEPYVGHEHAEGPWCWVLTDVRRLEMPIVCRGALGLWALPDEIEQQVRG